MVNLGTAYRTHAEIHSDPKALDLAISIHEDALTLLTPAAHPEWDTEVRQNCLARSLMARGGERDVELPDLSNLVKRLTNFPSGCGGFADIFMGEWSKTRRLKQKVAIKVLRQHGFSIEGNGVNDRVNKMLRAGIRIWHALDHPNIVKLLGTCRGFSPYASMILPWFANGSLPSFLQKHKSLIYSERLRIIREVAAGLAYLHSNAIIHGDLTGANVLISDDHSACLSDFGLSVLARDFDLPSMSCFTSGAGGSVRWTAPELYAFSDGNDGAVQPRLTLQTDVYAFGCVALEIFSGEVPYCNVQNEMEVLLKYVVPGILPERPTKAVSDRHWNALKWCWATDSATRPSSKALSALFEDV
ncbi:hypothetical protein EW145_g8351 [Phellinidium pouzarii]|uniref:Protein kinase domain-containing protein n=1 Tax=Phellinidium pouzarii TaxID=167371 RepID=A0A4S4K6W0_9AGAM|nr:hypothetical protein EW145_g8351 [Phellinidium pouzarii]